MVPNLDCNPAHELGQPFVLDLISAVESDQEKAERQIEQLDKYIDGLRRQDSKDSLERWRSWASDSVLKGGRAAHAFSRKSLSDRSCQFSIPVDEVDLPLNGDQAVQALIDQWLPLWYQERREGQEHPSKWDAKGDTLPPLELDQLLHACRGYAEGAGLGWDAFHPRLVLLLPQSYQERILDILHGFEEAPEVLSGLLANIIFLDKPDGGVRPI